MKQLIKIFIISILFSSCYNYKVAKRQIFKAYGKYPSMTAEISSVLFPPKDSTIILTKYVQGKTDTITQTTIVVNCDSLVSKKKDIPSLNTSYVKLKCPPSTTRIDTFIDHQYHTVENTAKVFSLNSKLQDLKEQLIVTETKSRFYKKLLTWFASFIIAFVLWKVIKMYFKIKLPI
jgi:hypothetical protein